MSDPLVPNYKNGVGRLVVDRFDFQNHITGTNFRHKASGIDLFPTVVIDGDEKENVQQAIEALSQLILPPVIPDASTTEKGILQISGDLSGTSTNQIVIGIYGNPVSNLTPTSGQVLTWNGSSWIPQTPDVFTPSGDLTGSGLNQAITNISGNGSGVVTATANTVTFDPTVENPTITQQSTSTSNGENIYITAQSTTLPNGDGGSVVISGGAGGSSGLDGEVILSLKPSESYMFHAAEVTPGNRVVGLVTECCLLSQAQMPDGTGDCVVYVANAVERPTTGNPSNGAILYAYDGKLNVKYSNGDDFEIGAFPNPTIWGPDEAQTYTYRASKQSIANVRQILLTYPMANNSAVKVDVSIIGRSVSSSPDSYYSTNMCMAYFVNNLGVVDSIGSLSSYDTRNSLEDWNSPIIENSGTNLIIKTGSIAGSASNVVNWFAVIQLSIVKG